MYEHVPWVSVVIGAGLFVLGTAMLFGFEPNVRLPRLDRGGRERTVGSMFVFGVSYAIASIGCTLPLFLTVVAGTISNDSLLGGLGVFAVYGLGMTLVLLALTVAVALARTSIVRFVRRAQPYIGRVSGGLVALAGAYVAYYGWLEVRLGRTGAATGSNVTDTVYGWSTDVTQWISDVGSVRIAVVVVILLAGTVAGVRATRSSGPSDDPAAPTCRYRRPASPRRPPPPPARGHRFRPTEPEAWVPDPEPTASTARHWNSSPRVGPA